MMTATTLLMPRLAAAPVAPQPCRPEFEAWEVGGQRFDSTASLVSSYKPSGTGVEATYSFRHESAPTKEPSRWDVASGALIGAAIGGGVAAGGAALLSVAGEILNALMMGAFSGGGIPILAVGLVGAAIGAFAGGSSAREGAAAAAETSVKGTLISQLQSDGSTRPVFLPGGYVQEAVDLEAYSKAPTPRPEQAPPQPRWKDALKGAAIGAATPLSALVPLAGLVAPTYIASRAVGAIDRNHSRGALLGGVMGAGMTIGVYAGINSVGWPLLAGLSGAGAVAGALMGPRALTHIRQQALDQQAYAGQWWSRYENPST